jgi:hypothetical protein
VKKPVAVATICAKNYIAKALVLQKSYLEFHPDHDFFIVLMDRRDDMFEASHKCSNLIWVEDLGIPDFFKHAFMFDIIEFSTNVKPSALKMLLGKYQKVLYIDPDIQVFDYLASVFESLDQSSVVVTPHSLSPIMDGKHPDDVDFLRFGAYNLGFVGVSNCPEAISFLDWWSARCLKLGFYEPQLGLAVDQKWIDLAPSYFPNLKILRDPGLNLSFWNLHERFLTKENNYWCVNEKYPLYFIHFSSFDSDIPSAIASKQDRFLSGDRADVTELYEQYASLLEAQGVEISINTPYSFDYFEDGVFITAAMRRFYAGLQDRFKDDINPFKENSAVRSFGEKKGLVSRKISPPKRQNFKSLSEYSSQLKIIYFILRILLKVLGPVRYFALMRLLPKLSSLRGQQQVIGD